MADEALSRFLPEPSPVLTPSPGTNTDAESVTALLHTSGDAQIPASYGAVEEAPFSLGPEDLLALVDPKSPELLEKLGGIAGLANALKSNIDTGLVPEDGDNAAVRVSVAVPSCRPAATSGPRSWANAAVEAAGVVRGRFFRSSAAPVHKHRDGFEARRKFFGSNALPEPMQSTIFQLMWEALQDRTLQVLMVAALVEMAIGIYKFRFMPAEQRDSLALVDGIAIIAAIIIVVLVGSISDLQKQSQFRALSEFGKSLLVTKVIRSGTTRQVPSDSIVVGDVCLLQTGDVVPSDGVLIQGFNIEADESTLTGEPYAIRKDNHRDPFLLSGTKVVNGVGRMLVTGTGVNSLNGRSILALEVEPEETPLQEKLGRIADTIAKFAVTAGVSMVIILIIIYFSINSGHLKSAYEVSEEILSLFILAVTIVVVAVPEGLPLAVTLSLAHATVRMLKDNNLVRHLSACETMGNATTICSDKTGTLTMNKMTVVRGRLLGTIITRDTTGPELIDSLIKSSDPRITSPESHTTKLLGLIACSLNINSTASESADKNGKIVFSGSNTEIAILEFIRKLGYPYQQDRDHTEILQVEPFSSEVKRMSTLVALPRDEAFESLIGLSDAEVASTGKKRRWIFVKGASEIILSGCTRYVTENGTIKPLTPEKRTEFQSLISEFADSALRTIGAAIKPIIPPRTKLSPIQTDPDQKLDDMTGLILVSIFGILDPVRPEVPDAVASCQCAGITVRMVTGDNLATAKAIARECGILSSGGLIMEGPEFRKLDEQQMEEILPRLQVLARSSPLDKQILVKGLKRLGETVAVTGDGTNDAPALTSADVGFSMGISGSEVAKEASDIVLMDDNFVSLVKAVVWGRTVYDSIRKFLQFQLTVNASAVIITMISAFTTTVGTERRPLPALSAVQLLWINLIMDTLAALALATDPPSMQVLNRKPSNRNESIISPDMMRQIVCQAAYQIIVILTIYYKGRDWWGTGLPESEQKSEAGVDIVTATIIFNAFVFCQVFNEFNSRSITRDRNVFKNVFGNKIFMVIVFVTVVMQIVIVQCAGIVFKTKEDGLDIVGWWISVLVGAGSLPVGFIARSVPYRDLPVWKNIKKGFFKIKSSSFMALNVLTPGEEDERSAPEHRIPVAITETNAARHEIDTPETRATGISVAPPIRRSRSRERWRSAITLTRIQLRVVRVFQAPLEDAQFVTKIIQSNIPTSHSFSRTYSGHGRFVSRVSDTTGTWNQNTEELQPVQFQSPVTIRNPSTHAQGGDADHQRPIQSSSIMRLQRRARSNTSPSLSPMMLAAIDAATRDTARLQSHPPHDASPSTGETHGLPAITDSEMILDAGLQRSSVSGMPTHDTVRVDMWDRLRSVMSASQAFHRGMRSNRVDYAALQMVDPNRVRMANSVDLAVARGRGRGGRLANRGTSVTATPNTPMSGL